MRSLIEHGWETRNLRRVPHISLSSAPHPPYTHPVAIPLDTAIEQQIQRQLDRGEGHSPEESRALLAQHRIYHATRDLNRLSLK